MVLQFDGSEVILNEWQWREHLKIIFVGLDNLHWLWALRLALDVDSQTLELGVTFFLIVLFHALLEILVAPGFAQVLKAHMQSLAQLPVANDLVHLHTNGIPVHVEDNTGTSMVKGVWHTLLDGRIHHDVNIVTTLELGQITTNGWQTFGPVRFGELVARTMTETAGVDTRVTHA